MCSVHYLQTLILVFRYVSFYTLSLHINISTDFVQNMTVVFCVRQNLDMLLKYIASIVEKHTDSEVFLTFNQPNANIRLDSLCVWCSTV